jgi:hypothetical protein
MPAPSGFDHVSRTKSIAHAASSPTLAKNVRMGHPKWEWCTQEFSLSCWRCGGAFATSRHCGTNAKARRAAFSARIRAWTILSYWLAHKRYSGLLLVACARIADCESANFHISTKADELAGILKVDGRNEHLRAPNKSLDRNDVDHLRLSCLHLSSAGQVRVRHHRGLPCAELCRSSRYNFPAWLRELFESFFDLPKAP